jgi:CRISPR system Cascade subunit CasC
VHKFVQLHMLTAYGPSNLNRDDIGRPKSCVIGGVKRLRVSSQAIKRSARTSTVFTDALGENHLGVRTRQFGDHIVRHLVDRGAGQEKAVEVARKVAEMFGKLDNGSDNTNIRQLCFIGPEEREAAFSAAEAMLKGDIKEIDPKLILRKTDTAVDVSMFGRMLADQTAFNREAAVQVSHAVTTHKCEVEDDFYTAVDDLNSGEEDLGAGFMGEAGFGSGIFYLYTCIDRALLLNSLGGDAILAVTGLRALVEALATVSPTGKQASYASRARASFVMAETGDRQPRSLIAAFQRAVTGEDILAESVARLLATREAMDRAYGACASDHTVMDVAGGVGTLVEVQELVTGGLE